ncbi:MAG: hypothetical protein J5944_08100 [Lentisphaeria bacterium]|nr:hypothetical protein [Lentisphaeria bacterium]
MKKSLLLAGSAMVAALVMTGCAAVATNNGSVTTASVGPNFYSQVSANAVIPQYAAAGAKIVKRDVTATATLKSFFTCVNLGDASYETLKAEALKQAAGATDLTNVKIDYKQNTICGITEITVKLTADAVKY